MKIKQKKQTSQRNDWSEWKQQNKPQTEEQTEK